MFCINQEIVTDYLSGCDVTVTVDGKYLYVFCNAFILKSLIKERTCCKIPESNFSKTVCTVFEIVAFWDFPFRFSKDDRHYDENIFPETPIDNNKI